MITGKQAFGTEVTSGIPAAVSTEEPDWSQFPQKFTTLALRTCPNLNNCSPRQELASPRQPPLNASSAPEWRWQSHARRGIRSRARQGMHNRRSTRPSRAIDVIHRANSKYLLVNVYGEVLPFSANTLLLRRGSFFQPRRRHLRRPPAEFGSHYLAARACSWSAAGISAIADHAVPAIEIHWSCPCGKPLSK